MKTLSRTSVLAVALLASVCAAVTAPAHHVFAGSIVAEYWPGLRSDEVGGKLRVNGYGVQGLGASKFVIEGGLSGYGMCVEANVGHSVAANYSVVSPVINSGALNYLTWRYLGAHTSLGPVQGAGMAVAVWALIGGQRSDGSGAVIPGDTIEITIDGVGRRTDVENAAVRFVGEGWRNRGPWTLGELSLGDGGAVHGRVAGPGGGIGGVSVSFIAGPWTGDAVTNDDGWASVAWPDAALGGPLTATAVGPGRAIEIAAPGSQRFALAGTPETLSASLDVPVPTTTTVPETTTTTTLPGTTTTVPETTTTELSTTTVAETTTLAETTTTLPESTTTTTIPETTTTVPETTTTVPETTTTAPTTATTTATSTTLPPTPLPGRSTSTSTGGPPPAMPATGGDAVRWIVRIGAALFALGGIFSFVASGSRQRREG